MTDIKRYSWMPSSEVMAVDDDGPYVLYADHVEAVKKAEQRGREYEHKRLTNHDMHSGLACLTNYEQGQRDALAAAVQRVEALEVCNCDIDLDTGKHQDWCVKPLFIAAIKGEQA